jgi:hypothetical protein
MTGFQGYLPGTSGTGAPDAIMERANHVSTSEENPGTGRITSSSDVDANLKWSNEM